MNFRGCFDVFEVVGELEVAERRFMIQQQRALSFGKEAIEGFG